VASLSRHEVLVVGAGSIGERHIRCFGATGRATVSFVEVNPELRATIAARYAGTTAHESIDTAIERLIDVAVVATPAPLHVPQAMALVERGVHVLIEKPLSTSMDGVGTLSEMIAAKRVVGGVAYVLRGQPALAEMRDAIVAGTFGKPLQLVCVAGQNFPFYRPGYRSTYYAQRSSGGGAIQDALTHVLNAGQWLVGDADRVVADAAHLALEGVEVEDTVHVLARHGDVLASYSLNQHQAPNETTITVICARGTARWESHESRWRSMERPGDAWRDHNAQPAERDMPFIRQANAFLDAVEGKSAPLCTLEEAITSLKMNLAILESVDRGQWVALRPRVGSVAS
jgi:predicted dehydrogenase